MLTDVNQEIFRRLRNILEEVRDPTQDDWDPMEVGLLLAKLEYADLDLEHQRQMFSEMTDFLKSAEFQKQLSEAASLKEQAKLLSDTFATRMGFAGDQSNYYNIKNSFLNDVLLRRKGIPISLSLVYMGMARVAGLKAVGISFPGHFLVRILPAPGVPLESSDWRDQWFVDPFDQGALLSVEDCEKRLHEWTRGVIVFGPEALKVAAPTEIVSRMLRNLRAIFSEKEDWARLYWVLTALIELIPAERVEAYRERGFLFARMGRYHAASDDLKCYLGHSRDLQKVAHVERLLRFIESQRDFMN